MFGIYDSPILVHEVRVSPFLSCYPEHFAPLPLTLNLLQLYKRGFRVRGLAHPGHWATPVGTVFERYGNVKASKFSAYKLLKVNIAHTILLHIFHRTELLKYRCMLACRMEKMYCYFQAVHEKFASEK